MYRNDGLAKYLRCIVVIFTLCCYDVCGVKVVVRRSSHDVYDGRDTTRTTFAIQCVRRPSNDEHLRVKAGANKNKVGGKIK